MSLTLPSILKNNEEYYVKGVQNENRQTHISITEDPESLITKKTVAKTDLLERL